MTRYLPRPVVPLCDYEIDRAAHRRTDAGWLDRERKSSGIRVLAMLDGRPLAQPGGPPVAGGFLHGAPAGQSLTWLGPAAFELPFRNEVFLGTDTDGDGIFAIDLEPGFDLSASPLQGLGEFMDFRAAAANLPPFSAGAAATARAIFEWHHRHGFCAACGQPSTVSEAGWKRTCPSCAAEHFPRTDPVAIMLAVHGDHCLLGRQSAWPQGFWSCLAGFIEPGESIEQGAARELREEAGVDCDPDTARYLFSQPWPFPSSLMIGMILTASSTELAVDTSEIEAARWFSRSEIAAILTGEHSEAYAPPSLAIAHHILRAWIQEDETD